MNIDLNMFKKMNNNAKKNEDIPVSAIIVHNNKIIAKGYNKKYKNSNPLDHAEIIVIRKACKKLNRTNLMDCDLYVTLKPCGMCAELIKECRIKRVYYILDNNKQINDTTKYIKMNDSDDYFSKELKGFFRNKR